MKQRATEHPILMCGDMVRAILDGTKTETRRMAGLNELNKFPTLWRVRGYHENYAEVDDHIDLKVAVKRPYGVAGDTLWVKETFHIEPENKIVVHECSITRHMPEEIYYRADYRDNSGMKWKPSLFMRKEQSRITLTVKGVTLERLHDITDEGARAEGITDGGCLNCGNPEPCGCHNPSPSPRDGYIGLWKQLNGEDSWAVNPWVWVVKFDVKEVRK